MSIDQTAALATFGAVWGVLAVGHNIADHIFGQTDSLAEKKEAPTADQVAEGVSPRQGWGACLGHVALYHLVMAALFILVWAALPLRVSWIGLTAGLVVSATTHAVFDRRWLVRWLLQHTGSPGFADLAAAGLNGLYLADQALHQLALLVCAVLIARL